MNPPTQQRRLSGLLTYVEGSTSIMELSHPYPIVWQYKGSWYRFWVPAGFRCDVASIPRIFWPLVSPTELGFEAPLAHDYLISVQGKVELEWFYEGTKRFRPQPDCEPFTRAQSDRLFCYLMRERKPPIPRWKRRWAFRIVRAYGWSKKHFTGSEW